MIILDEASSRLDPATERHLERAIDTLLQNRTAIIIAHRLSTVQRADEIMILEEGQIREYGEYENLAANPNSILFVSCERIEEVTCHEKHYLLNK